MATREEDARKAFSLSIDELENDLALNSVIIENGVIVSGHIDPNNKNDLGERVKFIKKDILNKINSMSEFYGEKFSNYICDELRYCERKDSDTVNLIIAIADSYYMSHFADCYPRVSISVYLLKKKFLDPMCNC